MIPVIRVTKQFHFEMAHVLFNYDGPCRNVHGHSYKLYVTISGKPLNDLSDPKNGMVIDFTDLKAIVKKEILEIFDHALVISKNYDKIMPDNFRQVFGNVVAVNYQPTCENLVADFAERIKIHLPIGINLFSIKLYETATSYAEWFAADNTI